MSQDYRDSEGYKKYMLSDEGFESPPTTATILEDNFDRTPNRPEQGQPEVNNMSELNNVNGAEVAISSKLVTGNGSFGDAVDALKKGRKVCRSGWNGKGLFVFMQVPSEISEEIVPKMQSLPQSVKDEFAKRGGSISYSNQMALVNPNNSINGWAPSSSDALADDWMIVE